MRPHSLTLSGFRSYAGTHRFDLAGRGLVGVVGPIGSGKSSLLDAIAFALYGRTPSVARDTRSLINQRAAEGKVELWFEVDGEHWRAVRALRRAGQSEHVLYRHYEPTELSERLEVVTGERAVTDRVTELLGLAFPAFQRSVLLAQNQFAAFLKATPGERDDVLRGVFGFDRVAAMQAVARVKADAAERDLAELERMRAEIEADRSALADATGERELVKAHLDVLEAARPAVAAADAAVAEAVAEQRVAAQRVADLESLGHSLPAARPGELDDAREAEAAYEAATKAFQAEHQLTTRAEAEIATVLKKFGDRKALTEATLVAQRLEDRRAAEKTVTARRKELDKVAAGALKRRDDAASALAQAERAVADAEAARQHARDARVDADEAFHTAEHADMAAALRGGLVVDHPCPVCERVVEVLPKRRRPASLASAEKARASAVKAEAEASARVEMAAEERSEAAQAVAAAEERLAAAERAAHEAGEAVTVVADEVTVATADLRLLAGERHPEKRVAEWQRKLTEAETHMEVVRRGVTVARTEADEALAQRESHRAVLGELSRALAVAAERLGVDLKVAGDPKSLGDAVAELRRLWHAEVDAANEAATAAAAHASAAIQERDARLAGLDLDNGTTLADAIVETAKLLAVLEERVGSLHKRVARVAELEAENAAAVARLDIYRTLAADLKPSRFLKYLLDEERARLAHLGSERFERLSGGRYRFGSDGDFGVVDLFAADAVRSADSLSGGETFLASLALALALADMVTREGSRLDAFFLDEGFGSLDAEHLDLAMDGVERLVSDAPNRLVVLVSHVPELRHRIEDLIELDRDAVTGDTVVKRG